MNLFLKLYLIALPTFLAIDAIWLGLISKNFYKDQIGFLMREKFLVAPALTFYALFCAALVYFSILPNIKENNLSGLVISSLIFGFITYATYDLTNYAVIKDWPLSVTLIDMAWGATVALLTSLIVYYVSNHFKLLSI